jgi:prepilin-type N-terminal cleavage/methylation domain-containing protein
MNTKLNKSHAGFTLIEMIGVLAIIAILAALLVPKIFSAINDSRFSNAVSTINSCKAATMNYFGKNSSFPVPTNAFDKILVADNDLERLLAFKIGTTPILEVTTVLLCGGGSAGSKAYKLDGETAITGDQVVQIVITNVAAADALELSTRMDGASLSGASASVVDAKGRVEYDVPAGTPPVTDVFVYLAHK